MVTEVHADSGLSYTYLSVVQRYMIQSKVALIESTRPYRHILGTIFVPHPVSRTEPVEHVSGNGEMKILNSCRKLNLERSVEYVTVTDSILICERLAQRCC